MESKYWYEPFISAKYRFMRVSRATGHETERITVIRGGSITRNDDTRIKESAEFDMVGRYSFGPDFLRVYADFEWLDGTTEEVCLGTFLPVIPSREIYPGHSKAKIKLYGRLQELLDMKFAQPRTVPAGTNAVALAKQVCEEAGLEVIADVSDFTTTLTRAYGLGVTSQPSKSDETQTLGDTLLDMVNDLLSLAGFRAAFTDPWGRIVMQKYKDPAEKPIVWDFTEGPQAKFEGRMSEERDYTSAANHVVVIYGSMGSGGDKQTIVGEAVDEDPNSDLSTVSRGRVITRSYSYSELPPGETWVEQLHYANERAKSLLMTAQSVIERVNFSHVYAPTALNDVVMLRYPSGEVNGRYQIRTQTIKLVAGCPVSCEARIFRRRNS